MIRFDLTQGIRQEYCGEMEESNNSNWIEDTVITIRDCDSDREAMSYLESRMLALQNQMNEVACAEAEKLWQRMEQKQKLERNKL